MKNSKTMRNTTNINNMTTRLMMKETLPLLRIIDRQTLSLEHLPSNSRSLKRREVKIHQRPHKRNKTQLFSHLAVKILEPFSKSRGKTIGECPFIMRITN
jgi:hypothetical protein